MTELSPFEGYAIVFDQNDTLWLLGWQLGEGGKIANAAPHYVLHRYSREGLLLSRHLPWPGINCGVHPLMGRARLAASEDRIGVFLPTCNTWLDVALTGDVRGRWQWQLPEGYESSKVLFWTAVMTPDSRVYCHVTQPDHPTARGVSSVWKLNRNRSTWEVVDSAAAVSAVGKLVWLAGVDRAQLVYATGNEELAMISLADR